MDFYSNNQNFTEVHQEAFNQIGEGTGKKYIPANLPSNKKMINTEIPYNVVTSPIYETPNVNQDDFGGPFNFQYSLISNNTTKPSFVFSKKLSKVYINTEQPMMVYFSWLSGQSDLWLRAVMLFRDGSNRSDMVHRCYAHMAAELPFNIGIGPERLGHVFSADNPATLYVKDHNGMLCTMTPLGPPGLGFENQVRTMPIEYKFYCRNSCATGIQRRPTKMVFTLENSVGEVLGRRSFQVQICSCPKRDKDKEEISLEKPKTGKKIMLMKPTTPAPQPPSPPLHSQLLLPERNVSDHEIHELDLEILGEENYKAVLKYAYTLMVLEAEHSSNPELYRSSIDEITQLRGQ